MTGAHMIAEVVETVLTAAKRHGLSYTRHDIRAGPRTRSLQYVRDEIAWTLRQQGFSYRQIGDVIGRTDHASIRRAIDRHIRRRIAPLRRIT